MKVLDPIVVHSASGGRSAGAPFGSKALALAVVACAFAVGACDAPPDSSAAAEAETGEVEAGGTETGGTALSAPTAAADSETHFANLTQLTFGGENAEAYFSTDDEWLIYQGTPRDGDCDQIYVMRTDGSGNELVSTGKGRTTCGYFFPGGERLLYSSTHLGDEMCPPRPDYSQGYVWALYPDYDIFTAARDGSGLQRLTYTPGYDAEATFSRDGEWILFTSVRDGDLDIYKMRADGSELTRLTDEVGYDGGAFFSYDGSRIVYRAYHPTDSAEIADYRRLLSQNLIRPSKLDIWVMDADGGNKRRLTDNGAANFAPYFFPDGERIIFSSNMDDPGGREFELYTINVDGTGLERVTWSEGFDGFPMFNSDGSRIVWASNRDNEREGETNIFIADWVD